MSDASSSAEQGRRFISRVADVRLESRAGTRERWLMSLDETAFVPGDTGVLEAVTRTGTRLHIPVLAVTRDAEDVVWHAVEKPLAAGTDVAGVPQRSLAD